MYQFSDSESVDSDEGIRYKTESIRNKSGKNDKEENKSRSHRDRKRSRSRSRSRSRYHSDRTKLKKHKKDYSPEDNSRRKSKSYRSREDDRENRRDRDRSKRESTGTSSHKRVEEPSEHSKKIAENEESIPFGPILPKKEIDNHKKDPHKEESYIDTNHTKSSEDTQPSLPFGPILPPKLNTPNTENKNEEQTQNGNPFGPQLPPRLKKSNEDNVIGPVLPSHFITVSSLDDDSSVDVDLTHEDTKEIPVQNNVIGPALPPHLQQQSENSSDAPKDKEEASEDEDVYGPVPVGANYSQAHLELEERALKMKMDQLEPSDEKPVREEWMLALPEAKAAQFGLGPRQFRNKAGPDMSDRSSWTDTAEDKAKKKEGKVEPVLNLKREAELKHIETRNKEQEAMAKKHKKEKDSLLDIHTKKLKKEKKSDSGPSERRPFSRETDLQVNRFDEAQKKAVLKKAQLLDNRFSSGESKFL